MSQINASSAPEEGQEDAARQTPATVSGSQSPTGVFRRTWGPDGTELPAEPADSPPPGSTNDNGRQPMSRTLWGLDWHDYLPLQVSPQGHTVEVGDWERVRGFLMRTAPQLVERNASELSERTQAAKLRYIRDHCDLLEFRLEGELVGIFIGEPADWSTYYLRVFAIDPRHGARPVMRRFVREVLVRPLRDVGVQRLTGETLPSHQVMIRWFLELGFQPTGQRLTDRWGPLIEFTKLLEPTRLGNTPSLSRTGA